MNRKNLILLAAVVLCAGLAAFLPIESGNLFGILALPFTLIGDGLRALSLMGGWRNVLAIVLYAAVCLSPLALIRRGHRADWLLIGVSGMMFYVMYLLVNPALIPWGMGNAGGKALCAGVIWSVLTCWGVLRLLEASEAVRQENLYKALRIFLVICVVCCGVNGIGFGLRRLLGSVEAVKAANTMPGLNLWPTYIVLFLGNAVEAAELLLDGWLMLQGVKLLQELEKDAYSAGCAEVSRNIAVSCRKVLAAVAVSSAAMNVIQLLMAGMLHQIDMQIRIPVSSMAICFGLFALVRLLDQGKELKEDNDLFI